MNRSERRRNDRHQAKLKGEVRKLTPNQTLLVEELVEERASVILEEYKNLVAGTMLQALRDNRVSLQRANKIIDDCNNLMLKIINEGENNNESN